MKHNDMVSNALTTATDVSSILERELVNGHEHTAGYLFDCAARNAAVDGPLGPPSSSSDDVVMAAQPRVGLTA